MNRLVKSNQLLPYGSMKWLIALIIGAVSLASNIPNYQTFKSGINLKELALTDSFILPDPIYNALYDIYTSTDGENWCYPNGQKPWNFSSAQNAPCTGRWAGIYCDLWPSKNVFYVRELQLTSFCLRGEIPNSIGNLSGLVKLDLSVNALRGTIPSTIGNFVQNEMLGLPPMNELILEQNHLSGTVPSEIADLVNITLLFIDTNTLRGPFPVSILCNLKIAQFIDISSNFLSGTIPSCISNLKQLSTLYMDSNNFTGTIPNEICDLSSSIFQDLSLLQNQLNGTLPNCLSNLTNLRFLQLSMNYFTGTLPLYYFKYLQDFYASNNRLHGKIPNFIGYVNTSLSAVVISNNFFTGSFPESLYRISAMETIDISYNLLTGTLPPFTLSASRISELSTSMNLFHGTIPLSYGNFSKLAYLTLNNNYLSGSIPSSLLSITKLQILLMQSNVLSSAISSNVGSLEVLRELRINDNFLSGNIFEYFNPVIQQSLAIVNLANNLFHGTIPYEFFNISSLLVLSASSNCLSGTLPLSVCGVPQLQVLDFDVAGANPGCPLNINANDKRPFFVQGIFSNLQGLSGTIPTCLFDSTVLTSLKLSENGLIGRLSDISNNSALTDLTLSYNQLSGMIPGSIQRHSFQTLDLSHNRFDGTLLSDFKVSSDQSTVALAVNRISGPLPKSLYDSSLSTNPSLTSLNILAGNIFACNNNDIPSLDENSRSYSCGSYELEISFYLWVSFLGTAFLTVAITYILVSSKLNNSWSEYIQRHVDEITLYSKFSNPLVVNVSDHLGEFRMSIADQVGKLKESKAFLIVLRMIMTWVQVMLLLCLLMIPIYVGLKQTSIVTFEYGYVISITFLHGYEPVLIAGIVVFTIMTVLYLFQSTAIKLFRNVMGHSSSALIQVVYDTIGQSTMAFVIVKYSLLTSLHIINITATVTVNAAYVFAILSDTTISRSELLFLQVLLGMFKIAWNSIYIPFCARRLVSYMSLSRSMSNRFIMSITNFIVAPCVATVTVNQSCFYHVFKPNQMISSQVNVPVCLLYFPCNNDDDNRSGALCCTYQGYVNFTTSATPAFQYSYACGTALLVSYIPVLIYSYAIQGFIVQIVRYVSVFSSKRSKLLPNSSVISKMTERVISVIGRVRGRDIVVNLCLHFTVLLTFGLASPLLGIVICLAIISDIFMSQITIGKYFSSVFNRNNSFINISPLYQETTIQSDLSESLIDERSSNFTSVLILERLDMLGSWEGLGSCKIPMLLTVSIFWGLLFFDMISDGYGNLSGGVTSAMFAIVAPLVIFCIAHVDYKPLTTLLETRSEAMFSIQRTLRDPEKEIPQYGIDPASVLRSSGSVIPPALSDNDNHL